MFFCFLRKYWIIRSRANFKISAGVKNWCQNTSFKIEVKKGFWWFLKGFRAVYQKNSPNFFQVEATPNAFRKAINRV